MTAATLRESRHLRLGKLMVMATVRTAGVVELTGAQGGHSVELLASATVRTAGGGADWSSLEGSLLASLGHSLELLASATLRESRLAMAATL